MQTVLLLLSTLIVSLGYLVYITSILKGETKPHRTTRIVLLIITVVVFSSLLAQGNQTSIWLAGSSALLSTIVFVLAMKYGMGGWTKLDIGCLLIALLAIVMWKITNNPTVALFLSIGADFTGVLPTIFKVAKFPHTETWLFFAADMVASTLNLLAVRRWVLEEYAYALYLLLINTVIIFFIFKPLLLSKKASRQEKS